MAVFFQKTDPIHRIFDVVKASEFYVDYLGFSVDWEHHFEDDTGTCIHVQREGLGLLVSWRYGDSFLAQRYWSRSRASTSSASAVQQRATNTGGLNPEELWQRIVPHEPFPPTSDRRRITCLVL